VSIGTVSLGWGSYANLQRSIVGTDDLVVGRSWLDTDRKQEHSGFFTDLDFILVNPHVSQPI